MMTKFIISIILSSIIGLQIGVYLILRQKGISSVHSFLYSFSIYLIPFLIIMAHSDLYKQRHTLLKSLVSRKQLNQEKQVKFVKMLDTKRFLFYSFLMMIKDLLTPKDNLILVVKIAEIYNDNRSNIKKRTMQRRDGTVGIVKKVTGVLRGKFVIHASEQFLESRIPVNSY